MALCTLADVKLWLSILGKPITGISKANPGIVTCVDHNLMSGQQVGLTGINGMVALNGVTVTVIVLSVNTFSIGIDTTGGGYPAWTSGGYVGTDDPILTSLITSISAWIENYCERVFLSASYTSTYDGTNGRRMMLSASPVTAITSVTIDGAVIPAATIPTVSGYTFNSTGIALNGYRFSEGMNNVVVVYTAGYATIPAELALACTQLVALRYKMRASIGLRSVSMLQGGTTSFLLEIPDDIKTTIDNYKRRLPW
jgi:hypothetical protein